MTASDTILPLVRRWAVDWLNSHDPTACTELMVPEYALRIGAFEFADRDSYVTATTGQLEVFPGLGLTVHEVITDGTRAALRFTEHGASVRHDGRRAAWTGVVIFEGNGRQLVRTWAEEDYQARRRQLASGEPDAVAGPALAPWDTVAEPADANAEVVVRDWLVAGLPAQPGVTRDDEAASGAESLLQAHGGELDVLFSAGPRVAFHGRVHGVAADGDEPVSLNVSGLVTVAAGAVSSGHVVSDRLGLQSALKAARR